ncbi:MAG TPA: hypothetical protein VEH50_05725 [Methylomirabilota bacterium]|nr:hypothetical protein [Methylomirabilota bacterium]
MADTPATPAAPETSSPAASAQAQAASSAPAQPAQPKIKVRKHKQRSCDEKDPKGKLCAGHLKRWYDYPKEIESLIGPNAEIYRCEFCKTLYRPDPMQMPNSYTLRY